MNALRRFLVFVLIVGVSCGSDSSLLVQPSQCSIENARYLPIYDLKHTTLNVLNYEDILESVVGHKFYQFGDVEKNAVGGMFYGTYPVLVVYQPDENIPELHGYYYPTPWGFQHVHDKDRFSSEIFAEYQPFREFLNSPDDKEGYTPSAALHIYPELKKHNLTKIIDSAEKESQVSGCAVLFVLPRRNNRNSSKFEQIYKIFEEYYYNESELCRVHDLKADEVSYDYEEVAPLWTVFDHKVSGDVKGQHFIDSDQFNEYYSKYGHYEFEEFNAGFTNYSTHPTLIVLQPDKKIPELHGYYFNKGIESLRSYFPDLADDISFHAYKPFFEYILLEEALLDGLTPDAARYDYPYFFNFKLTKFINVEDLAEKFAVLLLAPSGYRPLNFAENYYAIAYYGIGSL